MVRIEKLKQILIGISQLGGGGTGKLSHWLAASSATTAY